MTIKNVTLAAALFIFTATSGLAATVTLNVAGGQLLGASNVNVRGTLYDVAFVDGSCAALFSGCDELSDFDFATQDLAQAAVFALFETVFLDGPLGNFDSDPTLTAGILPNPINAGAIHIPYGTRPNSASVTVASARNGDGSTTPDLLALNIAIPVDSDLSNSASETFARFTPIPIAPIPLPAGGILLIAGLAGLGALRARRKPGADRAA